MKIILAPDSFKGSLSAREAAEALAAGIRRVRPDAHVVLVPLADGGEGTLEAFLTATSGRRVSVDVRGPLGAPVGAAFGLLHAGQTAVVEMALASGLGLIPTDARDPKTASTYGVGELLLAATDAGATEIIVGLGGSATNDGGAGALQALGVRFLASNGQSLPSGIGGGDLSRVARIDISAMRFPVGQVRVTLASDVTNPLLGPTGASAVYGPQKGANSHMVAELDAALTHFAQIVRRDLGVDVAERPGAGAAGGLGYGLMAALGAKMHSGIDLVLDAVGFEAQARDADWVWTGEGRIDRQTAQGKAIAGVLARCAKLGGPPVLAFGGSVDEAAVEELIGLGLTAAIPIVSGPITVDEAMQDAARLLTNAASRVMRLLERLPPTAPPSGYEPR
ncbi:MAG: glycerate kinase [Armatimonadota bacterium]|nr:glycerate kinase [Armatimonadota bacterium]